ncbi:MAG TPA: glycerophosphodiester phosphodiesterase family protein [Bosea sp. (in: a-proteobacteria)]|jgi:glycerophosphoryl diester phosphodiesterase|uniref:glycerophosphodiester phosphodiesterase family protein n=1 Tax=Bosea sp. (in: a-proteobacteria) TaxID=1871050 RepID=UPI002E0E7FB4|nr:glycerophosphodiester phosphodiesterase family protein [Bosea sp. (in: a-proteobacteria)]
MRAEPWLTARPIAHRGLHDLAGGVIENSISAAQAAIAGGFAIECDVQLSADEEALVFHDFTLDRLTGETGRVDARKAAELSGIGLTGSGDKIPTLTGFLAAIGGKTPLVIEIKSRFDGDLRLAKRTAEIVAGRKDRPIVLKSFDPVVVAALRELAPGFARGIVAMSAYDAYRDYDPLSAAQKHALANLLHFGESQPDFVSWKVADLPTAAPFLCRKALGLPLMTWTVRTQEDRARAAEHADQMVFEGFRP